MMPDELWARVRAVDLTVPDGPACQHCPERALLQFRVEYPRTGVVIERGQALPDLVNGKLRAALVGRDLFACPDHAGVVAVAAAYEVVTGPGGGT